MDMKIVAVLAVAVVAVAGGGAFFLLNGDDDDRGILGNTISEKDFPNTDSRLWVYGNANEDDYLDDDDVTFLQAIVDGTEEATRLADANGDGKVNQDDVEYLEKILAAAENRTDRIDVYYIDNYFKVAKVSWPVSHIATSYCSGLYTCAVTGLFDKLTLVDSTIKNHWNEVTPVIKGIDSFGTTESPNYEDMMKKSYALDVYLPGYFDANADKQSKSELNPVGIDVMFLSTSDNSGVDYPNEYIDRSILMIGYLLQGNMTTTYQYIDWHDTNIGLMKDAVASMSDSDKAALIMARSSPQYVTDGTYSITGKDNTNMIHAEWAGVYTPAQHGNQYLRDNYNKCDADRILAIIDGEARNGVLYYIDNEHDGLRNQRSLADCIDADREMLKDAKNTVHYLGMAREAGNSPMYVIEMAFYQNVMYPGLGAVDYQDLFDEFFQMFLPDLYNNTGVYPGLVDHFFYDFGE